MRRLLLLMCTIFVSVSMSAESLSRAEALQKALQFMPGKQFEAVNDVSKARRGENDATDAFYIFNAKNKAGFVIVAGDDRAPSILGYADNGEIDMEQMPSNLKYWLESYTDQIRSLKNASPNPVWKTRGVMANIDPLIKTQWNQYNPYNGQCPTTASGDQCITGCVATALAQMMYYYQWPEASTAIPAYTTNTLQLSLGELPATTFNWSQMQETYDWDATDDEIAKLFRYVGQAMEMDYGTNETGGSSAAVNPEAMIKYFNYSKRMQCIMRDHFSNDLWESTIYQELAENRPVLYSGQSNTGGHQFICDGYKDGLFHINWGWGGMSDGYFVLSIANPDEQGAGGSINNDSYSYDQDAYIGFQKPIEGETAFPTVESYIEEITPGIYSRTSTETDFANVYLEGSVIPHYVVLPTSAYMLDCGWALCQDNNILQVVGTKTLQVDDTDLESVFWYCFYPNSIKATFGAGLADGKYQLCQVYRESESSDWQLCYGASVSYLDAVVNGTSLLVQNKTDDETGDESGDETNKEESFEINKITVSNPLMVNEDAEVTINVTNTGETSKGILYLSTEYNGSRVVIGYREVAIEPGQTEDITIQFVPPVSGTYKLMVTTDKACQNVIKLFEIDVHDAFTRKIVMEEGTGTWCGYCVYGIEGIKLAREQYPDNFIAIGLHASDQMGDAENYDDIISQFSSFPSSIINRSENRYPTFENCRYVVEKYKNTAIAKIEASAAFTADMNAVNVSTNSIFLNSNSAANYKIAYVVVEDHVGPFNQKNYLTDDPSISSDSYMYKWVQSAEVVNMEFNDVARGIYPDVNGLAGSVPTVIESGKGYTYSYTVDLPDNIQNKDNIRIVTLLIDGETGEIVNADECDVEAGSTSDTYKTITISKSGKMSYTTGEALDFGDFEDLKAYVATGFDQSGTIWLTRVKQVPAGTPILIKGTPEKSYEVPVMDKCVAYFENMFVGSASEDLNIDVTSADGKWNNYYIASGAFKKVTGPRTIDAGKCYLQLPASFNTAKAGDAQKVTISKNGKSSYAPPVDIDLTGIDDLKAYAATGYDAATSTIWLTRIFKIQAGEGVLLKGEAETEYTLPSAEVQAYYGNMFVGNTGDKITINETSEDGVWTNFYLASGQFKKVSGSREIGTNKSYLQLPTSLLVSSARGKKNAGINEWFMEELETETLLLGSIGGDDEDGTTRIDAIRNDAQPDVYYNLQGQRVDNPKKGLYVKNGKVVVIK